MKRILLDIIFLIDNKNNYVFYKILPLANKVLQRLNYNRDNYKLCKSEIVSGNNKRFFQI